MAFVLPGKDPGLKTKATGTNTKGVTMSCNCGDQFTRVYPAALTVFFDPSRKVQPLQCMEPRLLVCARCGDITPLLQDDERQLLLEDAHACLDEVKP